MESVASYPITRDDNVLSDPSDEVIGFIKEASKRPLEILSYFKVDTYHSFIFWNDNTPPMIWYNQTAKIQ